MLVLKKWADDEGDQPEEPSSSEASEKRDREPTPSKTPRTLKKFCPNPSTPTGTKTRRSITEVVTHFPSQTVAKVCPPEDASIVNSINKKKWATAAKLMLKHKHLVEEIKVHILELISNECKHICNPNNGFILWKSSPDDLKAFSFTSLEADLKRFSPFLFSILTTVTNHSKTATCAAASIALRGREAHLSAFAYYLCSILHYGGAKKAVFERLSKMAITTTHQNSVEKQKELALLCGGSLKMLKVQNEVFLNSEAEGNIDVGQRVDSSEDQSTSDPKEPLNMEELHLSDDMATLPFNSLSDSEAAELGLSSSASPITHPTPPQTYSIIFDNLDFFMRAHHQSTHHSNKSIHWIHHIAVQDRISTYHLSNDRPDCDILQYDLCNSLPGPEIQDYMRREFIVLGSRILTEYLAVFKPFKILVVHHMPHQYTEDMAKCSTDYPLGLLFKDENKTSDLVDTLRHLQKEYVPKGPDGLSNVLVGGDRLTEGNCRNIQWAFSDGATKEDRLEGLIFKFEDWHAIRNLFEIYHRIFYDGASSKDHGTLLANMTKLRYNVCYLQYHEYIHCTIITVVLTVHFVITLCLSLQSKQYCC
ncbi:uncharacterized protein LOC143123086 isoform X1 [Alosa pseudoharengus]